MGFERPDSFKPAPVSEGNCSENHADIPAGGKCSQCGFSRDEVMIDRDPKKEVMITYKEGVVDKITGPGAGEAMDSFKKEK